MITRHQCPYDKTCKCTMTDCCKGCETFHENDETMYLESENNKLREAIEMLRDLKITDYEYKEHYYHDKKFYANKALKTNQ